MVKKKKSKSSGVNYYWIIGLILLFQVFKYINANKDDWTKKDPEFLSEQKKMQKILSFFLKFYQQLFKKYSYFFFLFIFFVKGLFPYWFLPLVPSPNIRANTIKLPIKGTKLQK